MSTEDEEKQDLEQEGNEDKENENNPEQNQEANEEPPVEGNEDKENENNPEQNQEANEEPLAGTVSRHSIDSKPLISRKTGKRLQHGFNQTSLIWEKKPLAEILGGSKEAKSGTKALDKPSYHEYFKESTKPPSHLQTITESDSITALTEEEATQLPKPPLPRGESIVSIERRVPGAQIPSEWLKKKDSKLGVTSVWINQRLLAEFKSSGSQTSFVWDEKTLAEYLKLQMEELNPDILLQIEIQQLFQRWPTDWPSYYDY